jgi:hypothetical protein
MGKKMLDHKLTIAILILPLFVFLNSYFMELMKHNMDLSLKSYRGGNYVKAYFFDSISNILTLDNSLINLLKFSVAYFVNTWIFILILNSNYIESSLISTVFIFYFIFTSMKFVLESDKKNDKTIVTESFTEIVVLIFLWLVIFLYDWAILKGNDGVEWTLILPVICLIVVLSKNLKNKLRSETAQLSSNFDIITMCLLSVLMIRNRVDFELTSYVFIENLVLSYILFILIAKISKVLSFTSFSLEEFYYKYLVLGLTVQGSILLYLLY